MVVELQPVILAAGEGSKLYPLTENIAKCLLPIANVPMICYTVNYLEKYGFIGMCFFQKLLKYFSYWYKYRGCFYFEQFKISFGAFIYIVT